MNELARLQNSYNCSYQKAFQWLIQYLIIRMRKSFGNTNLKVLRLDERVRLIDSPRLAR